jgi:ABC-2 type transport system ATP-binding protein
MSQPVVSVCGVQKGFGNGDVLADVDLDVPAEEITLLMGPNGVGKTILLSCIAGGLFPDSGEISVLGEAPDAVDESLSFMLQDAMLVDQLTGQENVDFFRDLHPQSTDRLVPILERLDFEIDELEREVGDYSGGMKRKLELAISLSVDVPLYLLDEPTAALDMTTVETVHSLLAERRDAGDTVLLSSHLPTDAELADHIAVVTESGVSAVGSPADLAAAVPTVVLAEGTTDISEYVRDGRLFEDEIYRRGFLRPETDPETVRSGGDATTVQVREPSHTDIFNYYVHFRDGQDE